MRSPVGGAAGKKGRTTASSPALPNEHFGRYVLLDEIGAGGMAVVHRAVLTGPRGFQKAVALKRIQPTLSDVPAFRERFIWEARTAASLSSPNIVQVVDFGEIDGTLYLAMELVDGMSLDRLRSLADDAGVDMQLAAVYIVAQAALGLDFAHHAQLDGKPIGLVHRDVSPENILISRAGEVKVADFGIAKAMGTPRRLTTSGAVMGKLRYMSPEQAAGLRLDARSDVFGLGLVLFELLAGERLLGAVSRRGVMAQLRAGDFDVPSARNAKVPAELDRIVGKALAPERKARHQSAMELARDLEQYLHAHGPFEREDLVVLLAKLEINAGVAAPATLPVEPAEPTRKIRVEPSRGPRTPADPAGPEDAAPEPNLTAKVDLQPLADQTRAPEPENTLEAVLVPATRRRWLVAATIGALAAIVALVAAFGSFGAAPRAKASEARRLLAGRPVVLERDRPDQVGRDGDEIAAIVRARAGCERGDVALGVGDLVIAERSYRAALADYPGYAPARRGLGQVYARDGATDLALAMFHAYLDVAPTAPDVDHVRSWVQALEDDPSSALR
jgi:serine/threonine-protein kinase